MSVLEYIAPGTPPSQGIALQVCRFLKGCERTPVFDGPQYLYTRWRINCRSLYNPQATSYDFPAVADVPGSPGPFVTAVVPAQTDQSIRHRLMIPRGQLTLGVGKLAWLVSPQQGCTVDSANGPTPLGCTVVRGPGGRSFVVDYSIETKVRECNLEKSFYPSIFLSHRWEMSHTLDEDFFTTRIIKGHVIFDTARLNQLFNPPPADPRIVPDQYRGAFFHPVPPNCQRRIPFVKQDPDGTSVAYVILDEEQQMNLGIRCTNVGVTRIEAMHEAAKMTAGGAKFIGSVIRTAGAMAGGAMEGKAGAAAAGAAAGGVGALAGSLVAGLQSIIQEGGSLLPMETHAITVRVHGNGQATKSQLLNIAQAICRVRTDRLKLMEAEVFSYDAAIGWDLKNRIVTTKAQVIRTPLVEGFLLGDVSGLWPTMPREDVVVNQGGGAYIASRDGTTNALPPGDQRSRGTFLENIVAQALTSPCEMQPAPTGPPWMTSTVPLPVGPGNVVGNQPARFQPA